ncbi:MAG TPA: preprotein translocase subunit YajC [Propionibacteriaceae bacterium]
MDPLTLAMIAVLIVVGYFLIIRPQQKRAKDAQALQSSLQTGSRVMMSGGIFGTLKHLGEKQVVVEVSPGVELTFVRQAIIRPLKDDEDEFEYADVAEPESVEIGPADPGATAFAAEPESGTAQPTDKLADQG